MVRAYCVWGILLCFYLHAECARQFSILFPLLLTVATAGFERAKHYKPNSCHFGKPASICFTIFLNEIACLRKGQKHEPKMPNFLSIDRCQLLRTKRHHPLRQQRPECKAECLGCRPEILYAGLLPSAGSVPGHCQHHCGGSSFSTSRLQ